MMFAYVFATFAVMCIMLSTSVPDDLFRARDFDNQEQVMLSRNASPPNDCCRQL